MDRNKDLDVLESSTVYDSENEKVGPVGQIYLDGKTNEPKFVTVNTGLFSTRESFVPYDAANHTADGLSVPFTKDFIKDAPNIDADGPIVAEDQQRIFDYYQSDAGGQTQVIRPRVVPRRVPRRRVSRPKVARHRVLRRMVTKGATLSKLGQVLHRPGLTHMATLTPRLR